MEKVEQFGCCDEEFVAEGFEIAAAAAGGTVGIESFYVFIEPGVNFSDLGANYLRRRTGDG
ncbi:MAG: hypothetical protein JW806_01750 [Sedimentisphaerales bacterium]|nr:hypothetical protein [Sedimentisphaerales bacterium]